MSAIEDIILDRDKRGVSALRTHLPENFCEQAARLILDNPGRVLILTGFYIMAAGAPETDGPPGAYFLGRALQALGHPVTYVADRYSAFLFKDLAEVEDVSEFPITDSDASERFAKDLLARLQPSVVISIERCGPDSAGRYLNMLGADISQYTAKLDYLVLNHNVTVGIGDGGNEIGMGNVVEQIPLVDTLPREPATTPVTQLVIASVSNWGGYGLVAAMSRLTRRNLLPTPQAEEEIIRRMVDQGAVDGIITRPVYAVDGFPLEENRLTLEQLHALLADEGIGASGGAQPG
ncbi:MAG: DUF4392 domain-containing protein [Dehalococcoidia bacterium]